MDTEERNWLIEAQFLARIIKSGYAVELGQIQEPQSEAEAVATLARLTESLLWLATRAGNIHDAIELQLHERWKREAGYGSTIKGL
jgi:hypothetical protein